MAKLSLSCHHKRRVRTKREARGRGKLKEKSVAIKLAFAPVVAPKPWSALHFPGLERYLKLTRRKGKEKKRKETLDRYTINELALEMIRCIVGCDCGRLLQLSLPCHVESGYSNSIYHSRRLMCVLYTYTAAIIHLAKLSFSHFQVVYLELLKPDLGQTKPFTRPNRSTKDPLLLATR